MARLGLLELGALGLLAAVVLALFVLGLEDDDGERAACRCSARRAAVARGAKFPWRARLY